MDVLVELERKKWDAFDRKDADVLNRMYHPQAISIGYAGDGSVGARRTADFLRGLIDLDVREPSLEDFEFVPVGDDGAVVTYRARYRTGRGVDTAVIATSVWHRDADEWKTMFFQATAEPVADR